MTSVEIHPSDAWTTDRTYCRPGDADHDPSPLPGAWMHLAVPIAEQIDDRLWMFECPTCGDVTGKGITPHWFPLSRHPVQDAATRSRKRFRVVVAGRRSSKTLRGKRMIVEAAYAIYHERGIRDGRFACLAPTHMQAKRIFWTDLKRLVHPSDVLGRPLESELTIRLKTGAEIMVVGMDKPHRIEGVPLDGVVVDEAADMREEAWTMTVQLCLATPGRPGWAWICGKPRGRNHLWRMYTEVIAGDRHGWEAYHWTARDILPPEEIAQLEASLDPLSVAQEVDADFVNFEGRAYYSFSRDEHAANRLHYRDSDPLILCFDFNRAPGVAAVVQETDRDKHPDIREHGTNKIAHQFTAVIGEVWIPKNSTTTLVTRRLCEDWKHHKGDIYLYGDATGGAKGSAKVDGSDWDLVHETIRHYFPRERIRDRVERSNPPERTRVNAVNTRILDGSGEIHLLADPVNARHVVEDFEGVVTVKGGSGEIDKDDDDHLTHLSDSIGYYCHSRFPIGGPTLTIQKIRS
jgi:hypothetical protein